MKSEQGLVNAYDAWLNTLQWQTAITLELNPSTLTIIDSTRPQAGPNPALAGGGGHQHRNMSARSLWSADDLKDLINEGLFKPLQRQHRGSHILAIGVLVCKDGNTHAHILAYDASGKVDLAETLDTKSDDWGWDHAPRLYSHRKNPPQFSPPELYARPYEGAADQIRTYFAENLEDDQQGLNSILTWGHRRLKQDFRRLAHRHAA